MTRKNVVLIMTDQWRGDCLSYLGHPTLHTPHLDELANRGTVFTNAYSATPTCIAARAALLTGLHQKNHGRVGYRDGVEWNYSTTLPGEFGKHGYRTHCVGKMHVYPTRNKLGFETIDLHDGYMHAGRREHRRDLEGADDYLSWLREKTGDKRADHFDTGLNCNSYNVCPWDKPDSLHPTSYVTTKGIEFLENRDEEQPFFLKLSYHRPHPPLDPPKWALDQYLAMDIPDSPKGNWIELYRKYYEPHLAGPVAQEMKPHLLRRAKAAYFAQMTFIDLQINRFLETIDEFGLKDDTIVLFTADHGDLLGDHNLFRKTLPYEGSACIPMIIAGGDVKAGERASAPVELRDVMPTLLEAAGLPVPDSIDGRSFLNFAKGDEQQWRDYIHGEHTYNGQGIHWITDGEKKYIWMSADGTEQFFDLENDPSECNDLIYARRAREADVAPWRNRLIAELADRQEGFSDGQKLISGRPVTPVLDSAYTAQ